jgi:hypothetical protein
MHHSVTILNISSLRHSELLTEHLSRISDLQIPSLGKPHKSSFGYGRSVLYDGSGVTGFTEDLAQDTI